MAAAASSASALASATLAQATASAVAMAAAAATVVGAGVVATRLWAAVGRKGEVSAEGVTAGAEGVVHSGLESAELLPPCVSQSESVLSCLGELAVSSASIVGEETPPAPNAHMEESWS
jgi:hypothetical protein